MRNIFTLITVLFLHHVTFAQPYLFSASYGQRGSIVVENPHGTLSKFDVATNKLTAVYSFKGPDGSHPAGKLIQASDGNFYGVTSAGGAYNSGVLFSFNPVTNTYNRLHDFNKEKGENPASHVIQASDGKLYGMTTKGGVHGMGIIYSFNITTKTLIKLFDFNGPNGAFPTGGLLQAADGKLYGMTPEGGALLYGSLEFTSGILFSFDLLSNTFTKLREFGMQSVPNPPFGENMDGAKPYGGLIQAKNGKLYGTTAFGGQGSGTVFSYDPTTKEYLNKLFPVGQFHPYASLLEATDGFLYGLTREGGTSKESGVAFVYNPAESSLQLMGTSYLATAPPGPVRPTTSFIQATDGKLYGIASEEADFFSEKIGSGFIFSKHIGEEEFSRPAIYDGKSGANPMGALTEYLPCTKGFKISIPDVMVLQKGVQKNTVYLGYMPASSAKLIVQAGNDKYTYKWSDGSTKPHLVVNPTKTTTYSVTVTDSKGCTATTTKEIKVIDVHCGNKGDKVLICKSSGGHPKKSEENCVSTFAVAAQLANGAHLGNCGESNNEGSQTTKNGLSVKVLSNPTSTYFTLNINSARNQRVSVIVFDMQGRIVETRLFSKNAVLQIGQNYKRGTYFALIIQQETSITTKLVKQ